MEEESCIVNNEEEVLNSKNEWHQPKTIRTTVLHGGAEMTGGRINLTLGWKSKKLNKYK